MASDNRPILSEAVGNALFAFKMKNPGAVEKAQAGADKRKAANKTAAAKKKKKTKKGVFAQTKENLTSRQRQLDKIMKDL